MRKLPGLCGDYCSDYWHQCRYTLSLLLEDLGVLQEFANLTAVIEEDRRRFCDFLVLKDKQYCYPNVVNNAGMVHARGQQAHTLTHTPMNTKDSPEAKTRLGDKQQV